MSHAEGKFRNRYFAGYMVAFFALWAAATVVSVELGLAARWTVLAGIVVGGILDHIMEWLQDWWAADMVTENGEKSETEQ